MTKKISELDKVTSLSVGTELFEVVQSAASKSCDIEQIKDYIDAASEVTYENLNTNGDVGTGAAQVAQGNHTHAFSEITSTPTTLAGYGITDAGDVVTYENLSANSDVGTGSSQVAQGDHDHAFSEITSTPTTLAGYGITDAGDVVTYENLNTNGDVGTGASQVAQGNHTHAYSAITGTHGNEDHSSTFITSTGVTYENLNTNGDVGTGSSQVAQGNHTHAFSEITSTPTTLAGYGITDALINNDETTLTVTDNVCDTGFYGLTIDHNVTGSDATTADRNHVGLYVDTDSSATGGDTSNEHRLYGIYTNVTTTGDSDLVYGLYNIAKASQSTGTISSLAGMYGYAQAYNSGGTVSSSYGVFGVSYTDNAGTVNNSYGGYFRSEKQVGSAATDGAHIGVYGEVEIEEGTITSARAVQAHIDRNAGTITTGYLFYGSYAGTLPTNNWGVYIASDTQSYFGGNVIINNGAPQLRLSESTDANGDWHITVDSNNFSIRYPDTGTSPYPLQISSDGSGNATALLTFGNQVLDTSDIGTGAGEVAEGNHTHAYSVITGTHGNEDHSSTFITSSGVTYENLNGNSDVGTGASQVARGNHTHAFSEITSTPTTLAGYGITDAADSDQGALADSAVQPNDSVTFSDITVTAAQGFYWESGVNGITHNDGGGNVQIRFGHDYSSSDERFTHSGTAFYIGGNLDNASGSLSFKVASNGGSGDDTAVTWGYLLTIGSATLTWNGDNVLTDADSLAWANITGTPTTLAGYGITDAASDSHGNESHSSTFITSTGVTYENLNTNGDVGTGSSQVAVGNHTHNTPYVLQFAPIDILSNPNDATDYWFGMGEIWNIYGLGGVECPISGTIEVATIYVRADTHTSEAWNFYIGIAGSYTTIAQFSSTDTTKTSVNTTISESVSVNDQLLIKMTTPTWTTNPTQVACNVCLYIS